MGHRNKSFGRGEWSLPEASSPRVKKPQYEGRASPKLLTLLSDEALDTGCKINMLILGMWGANHEKPCCCGRNFVGYDFCRFECASARALWFDQRRKLKGGAYTNDQTGSFSHCAAGVPYASGVFLW